MKKVLVGVLVLVVLLAGGLLVAPSFVAPSFAVRNRATQSVGVVATWRGGTHRVGRLAPGEMASFAVAGEGGMQFRVQFAEGRERSAGPIYFTRGTTVIVTIGDDAVRLAYDHDD